MLRSTSAILRPPPSDQLVELGDRFAHLGPQLLVAAVGLGVALQAPLDAGERRSARSSAAKGPVVHGGALRKMAAQAGQALTLNGSPPKGAASARPTPVRPIPVDGAS
jgi:hypothetical protein